MGGTMPRETVLPRTNVPPYLDETPISVQPRHSDNFGVEYPHLMTRPDGALVIQGLYENLHTIEDNLNHLGGFYFDHDARKTETV